MPGRLLSGTRRVILSPAEHLFRLSWAFRSRAESPPRPHGGPSSVRVSGTGLSLSLNWTEDPSRLSWALRNWTTTEPSASEGVCGRGRVRGGACGVVETAAAGGRLSAPPSRVMESEGKPLTQLVKNRDVAGILAFEPVEKDPDIHDCLAYDEPFEAFVFDAVEALGVALVRPSRTSLFTSFSQPRVPTGPRREGRAGRARGHRDRPRGRWVGIVKPLAFS
eukprot:7099118-Prymnesium_polylepis.1